MSVNSVPIIGDDSPRARRTDPETSHEAADSTAGAIRESRDFVFFLLEVGGPMCDHELVVDAEKWARAFRDAPRWSASRIRTARHELTCDLLVEHSGGFGRTSSGRRAKVWRVVS